MTPTLHPEAAAHDSYLHTQGRHTGIWGWLLTLDHKRIGILYLIPICIFFLAGMTLGVLMRVESFTLGRTIMGPQTYNALFTVHGVTMIFLFLIPSIPAAFGNFFLPLQLGARDVFFPRLNLISWYFYISGAFLLIVALFWGGKAPDTGWTFYTPYSTTTGTNITMATLAVFIIGFSSILTGINFITTTHRLRAPGMSWFRLPLFVWAIYATSWIQVLATPILGITLLMIAFDRAFGIGLFDPAKGGSPLLYQHMFWIYSHPAVYIMILPGMGVVSEIIPVFARRQIFGYKFIAFSSVAIAAIGSLVWGHHMFTASMAEVSDLIFSLLTYLVAIPSAIKVFNWVATLYKGSIEIRPPLLLTLFFIFLFMIGGLTGIVQGALGPDIHLHDTYWVVGHFHYIMFGGGGVMFIAALFYWFPKMTGRMYSETAAYVGIIIFFIGFNIFYFTMLILGFDGMPRRYYDYLPKYHTLHAITSIGAWIMASGLLTMFGTLVAGLFTGAKAPANPWGGATLEWTLPSPPPEHVFQKQPVITRGPYDFTSESPS